MTDRIKQTPIIERPELVDKLTPELQYLGARVYMMGGCKIILCREPYKANFQMGWHLSISRRDRDPTWDEIATARYRLCELVPNMAMYLPPLREYVNAHPHTFHLWET